MVALFAASISRSRAFLAFRRLWEIPQGLSTIVEAYPALYKHGFSLEGRTPDQQNAYAISAWAQQADRGGLLADFLNPNLTFQERGVAQVEGWILGVR